MARDRFIVARRCREGCLWLYPYDRCPKCKTATTPVKTSALAFLTSHTVVRVNPGGTPITLGVARAAGGAATLCAVDGEVRGNGFEKVRLVVEDGRYRALTPGVRRGRDRLRGARGRRKVRFKDRRRRYASRGGCRKS